MLDAAIAKRRSIVFLYPAPAGEVAILLAAQVLLQRFQHGDEAPSIGIVTADTVGAARAWQSLYISTTGERVPLSEVFPCWRATPAGTSPFGRRRFRGVLLGTRFGGWPVDMVIVDGLAGATAGEIPIPTVRVIADPLDPSLVEAAGRGDLVWAWTPVDIARCAVEGSPAGPMVPFSIALDRLGAIARGVDTTIHVAASPEAARLAARIRDDLRSVAEVIPPPMRTVAVLRGIRIAWAHLATLTSLPCRPSDFDRFAGLPPISARATSTFEKEIAAWARTLPEDAADLASIVASDLADLRACLEADPPFLPELCRACEDEGDTIVVVRTHTAARGLTQALTGRGDGDRAGHLTVRSLRRLHTEGSWRRAIVVGMPARWEWHRVDSGLSSDLHVLVLGDTEAERCRSTLEALRDARERWSDRTQRSETWRVVIGCELPADPEGEARRGSVTILGSTPQHVAPDPFEAFEPLLLSVPLAVGDEGVEDSVAEEMEDGTWAAEVDAVDIETDLGHIRLAATSSLEVRSGEAIVDRRADRLQPGDVLLIGRREGRIGLLDMVAERLKRHRPDLYAAGLVISDLRASVRRAFQASGMSASDLHRELVALGFEKSYTATRGYVGDHGPLAPRDFADLERLNLVLKLGLTERRMQEMFAAVQRRRGFRRAAGRALAAAARGSTVAADSTRIDPETGLSLADLREIVVQATVVSVQLCPKPVALAELGRLVTKAN